MAEIKEIDIWEPGYEPDVTEEGRGKDGGGRMSRRNTQMVLNKEHKVNKRPVVAEGKREEVGKRVLSALQALREENMAGRVELADYPSVKARTERYIEGCAYSGNFPSMMGLCAYGLGMDRSYLDNWCNKHPSTPSAQYIAMIKEVFADILTDASLNNEANVIQAIFQLKNHFRHEDHVKVEAAQSRDALTMGARTKEEIEARYKESVVVDD